mgnify:FL=1
MPIPCASAAMFSRACLIFISMAIITGCGKTNETTPPATTLMPAATQTGGKEMLPPAHPPIGKPAIHPVSGNQLKVITPPEVAAKWKAVELSILV